MFELMQVITGLGFMLGLAGAGKMKMDWYQGKKFPVARWGNPKEWEIGLKICAVGVCMWLFGLVMIGNFR